MNDELQKELDVLSSKLKPVAYEPSEVELLKAHVRYYWEEFSHDLFGLIFYTDYQLKSDEEKTKVSEHDVAFYTKWASESLPKIKEEITNTVDKGLDFWETTSADQMTEYLKDCLSDVHMGDCTGMANTCERCLAEETYRIPSTVKWGKGEGYTMLNRYFEIKELLDVYK